MSTKQFSNVAELINEISEDTEFKEGFERRLEDRKIVKYLVALRAAKGVSQSDIAQELGCSQSRVSKIENGFDNDLRIRELRAYMKALSCDAEILIASRPIALFDRVKYHVFAVRDALLSMVKLVGNDKDLVRGIAKMHAETFLNMAKMIQESCDQIPPKPDTGEPYVRITEFEFNEDDSADDTVDDVLVSASPLMFQQSTDEVCV